MLTHAAPTDLRDLYRQRRNRTNRLVAGALLGAVICGFLAAAQPVLLAVPALLIAAVVIWKHPSWAVIGLLATTTMVENFTVTVGTHTVITSQIPWWRTFTHGMILFPVEIYLLVVIMVWVLKAGLDGTFGLPGTPVTRALKVYWIFLLVAVGEGLSHGAHLKFDFWELRSWLYLTVAFLLAGALLRTRESLEAFLWALVVGTGLKGIEGTYIFFAWAKSMRPRPEAILGHEQAVFFGLFITLTLALWLYGISGRMRTTATWLLPFVFISDLANARRTAWLVLAACVLALLVIAGITLPERRRFVGRVLAVLLVVSAVYVPTYWNHDGELAQPARAVRSAFQPSQRDQSSDQYRAEEDVNLIANIKTSGLLGRGFGVPIDYVDSIANITSSDPMIDYIPHNGLLWIWLRMGMQGEMAFWGLIGVALVRASQLAKVSDRRLALFGALVVCAIVAYVIDGYEDMAFAEFQIAVLMGLMLGATEVGLRLARPDDSDQPSQVDPKLLSLPRG